MGTIFDWFKTKESQDTETKSKQPARRPVLKDWTESMTVNGDLTRGLYHNQYPGLKLAGSLAFAPIFVPVSFMGLPVPISQDEKTKEALQEIVKQFSSTMQQIHIQCHREGTVWVFPFWSSKLGKLVWELIPDDSVTDIIRDIETNEILKIITVEQLKIQTGENEQAFVNRTRYFTRDKLTVKYSGQAISSEIADRSTRNTFGIMPIPFSNNTDGNEIRGHSDYERILSDLKNYHDIDLAWSTLLAKFSVKMIQEVATSVDTWKSQNGIASLADIDVSTIDLIMNRFGQEKTSFIFPDGAHAAYEKKLGQIFLKLVEGSGIPEICWGVKTEGNKASAEEQMGSLVKFVETKMEQKESPYTTLFNASLLLTSKATMQALQTIDGIEWNNLDALSEDVKSQIFQRFADGVTKIFNGGAGSLESIHSLWRGMYPRATEADFEKWKIQMQTSAKYAQFAKASFIDALQATGPTL